MSRFRPVTRNPRGEDAEEDHGGDYGRRRCGRSRWSWRPRCWRRRSRPGYSRWRRSVASAFPARWRIRCTASIAASITATSRRAGGGSRRAGAARAPKRPNPTQSFAEIKRDELPPMEGAARGRWRPRGSAPPRSRRRARAAARRSGPGARRARTNLPPVPGGDGRRSSSRQPRPARGRRQPERRRRGPGRAGHGPEPESPGRPRRVPSRPESGTAARLAPVPTPALAPTLTMTSPSPSGRRPRPRGGTSGVRPRIVVALAGIARSFRPFRLDRAARRRHPGRIVEPSVAPEPDADDSARGLDGPPRAGAGPSAAERARQPLQCDWPEASLRRSRVGGHPSTRETPPGGGAPRVSSFFLGHRVGSH